LPRLSQVNGKIPGQLNGSLCAEIVFAVIMRLEVKKKAKQKNELVRLGV
jgi:hypothetical protein